MSEPLASAASAGLPRRRDEPVRGLRAAWRALVEGALRALGRRLPYRYLKVLFQARLEAQEPLEFAGVPLAYFHHSYNNSMLSERAVEIPILRHVLDQGSYPRVLEIGNVTKHYCELFQDFQHKDTVDRYERAYDVENVDIREFRSDAPYDLVFSISTFEHMDRDGGRNPDYRPPAGGVFSSVAFENLELVLTRHLRPGGSMWITFPLFQGHREIDASLRAGELASLSAARHQLRVLARRGECRWVEIPRDEIPWEARRFRFPGANYLCVLELIR